jgi:hypothetical protein
MSPDAKGEVQGLSDLLDDEWDPIGVYAGPADEHAPPRECGTNASGMYRDLQSGGGKSGLLLHMKRARGNAAGGWEIAGRPRSRPHRRVVA